MDTPDRNQINTPLSGFEESPVFNFLNSLSPIRSVKSAQTTQTFNSLSFSSPPSVFTSPHVSCHKESRFLRRHNLLEASKPNDTSEDVNKIYSHEEAPADSTHAYDKSSELQQDNSLGISVGDASIEPSGEHTKFSIDLPQALKFDSGSPSCDPPLCGDEANSLLELPNESVSVVAYAQEGCKKDSVEGEVHLQGACQIESRIEGPECDWDSLIADASDLLMCSPTVTDAFKGLIHKQLDRSGQFNNFVTLPPQSTANNGQKMHIVDSVASGSGHETENNPSESVAAMATDQTQDNLAITAVMANNASEKMNDEITYVTYRGIRRRCLDFEMASVRRKNLDDNSNASSSTAQPEEMIAGNEKKLHHAKHSGDSQKCILQGIGLHLNALATLKGYRSIKNEKSSGRQANLPIATSSLQLSTGQEHHNLSLVSTSAERDLDPSENGVKPAEDCTMMVGEDFRQNSPKKKRRKLESAGENESCKRCNCKKSKCLKLYCECFAAGVYCIEPCSCQDCFNKPIHEDTVLQTRKQIESRNPLAFAPKVIRSSDYVPEIGDDPNKTPASARHKRGCNCKKSGCLKKYCECYQGGVGCSLSCRCEGCKNVYGRKDGSAPLGTEAETEEEAEACEKGVVEKAIQKTGSQNIVENPDSALPTTPLQLSRPLLPLPFSSKGKPPRSFVTTISASGLFASQKLGKHNSLPSHPKFEKPFQSVPDDDVLDVPRGGYSSPTTCIKTSSPNGKRISSPNCDVGSSPGRRGGRKLILQSIPSFPSLTPHQ